MIESSPKKNIFSQWVQWHYGEASKKIIFAFRNFLVFNFHFFPLSLLCRTLFSPWRRIHQSYGRGFNLRAYTEAFITNSISRFLGFFVRIVTIGVGLISGLFIFLSGVISFVIWLFFPLFLVLSFISGLELLAG